MSSGCQLWKINNFHSVWRWKLKRALLKQTDPPFNHSTLTLFALKPEQRNTLRLVAGLIYSILACWILIKKKFFIEWLCSKSKSTIWYNNQPKLCKKHGHLFKVPVALPLSEQPSMGEPQESLPLQLFPAKRSPGMKNRCSFCSNTFQPEGNEMLMITYICLCVFLLGLFVFWSTDWAHV